LSHRVRPKQDLGAPTAGPRLFLCVWGGVGRGYWGSVACRATRKGLKQREPQPHDWDICGRPSAAGPPFRPPSPDMQEIDTRKAWNHAGGRGRGGGRGQGHNQGIEASQKHWWMPLLKLLFSLVSRLSMTSWGFSWFVAFSTPRNPKEKRKSLKFCER